MKQQRTTADIKAHLVACYEWKDVNHALPAKDEVVCVSVPSMAPFPRAVARFNGEQFQLVGSTEILKGVTFWCHAPVTPEDLLAEANAARSDDATPDLFKP